MLFFDFEQNFWKIFIFNETMFLYINIHIGIVLILENINKNNINVAISIQKYPVYGGFCNYLVVKMVI